MDYMCIYSTDYFYPSFSIIQISEFLACFYINFTFLSSFIFTKELEVTMQEGQLCK